MKWPLVEYFLLCVLEICLVFVSSLLYMALGQLEREKASLQGHKPVHIHPQTLTSKPCLTVHSASTQSLNQGNDISPLDRRAQQQPLKALLWQADIRSDTIILFLSADAAQQARDGTRRWRLGDLWELPAETRPVPHAPNLPGGGQDVTHQQQVPQHQGPDAWQLPGGGSPLPQQKVKTWDWKVSSMKG